MTTSPIPTTSSLEHQAFLALQTLAVDLGQQAAELLRASGLSAAQFNVLRILRGAGKGRTCGEISAQLISRDPDVTRLLDRLERAGLVTRTRERADRRVVTTRISEAGLSLLAALDAPVAELHRQQFAHLTPGQMQEFLALLALVQSPPA